MASKIDKEQPAKGRVRSDEPMDLSHGAGVRRVWFAAVPLAGLIAIGIWHQTSTSAPQEDAQSQVVVTPPTGNTQQAAATPQSLPVAVEQVSATADPAPEAPAAAVASVAAPTQNAFAPASCESAIAMELAKWRDEAAAVDASWETHRNPFRALVQKVLNCPQTGLDISGSLELVDLNLADLNVSWDGTTGSLRLEAIGVGDAALPDSAAGPSSLSFVLR